MATDPILFSSLKIGTKTAPNRIAINAMEGCDADTGGNPTPTAYRRYERLARGNAGVIVVEALSVVDENKGRLHQLTALPQNAEGAGRPGQARAADQPQAACCCGS